MVDSIIDGMTLYHGSYCVVELPDLNKCRQYKDFGRGFYLTTDIDQAKSFAKLSLKKAIENNIINDSCKKAYISCFSYANNPSNLIKVYEKADSDWLHCVVAHRKTNLYDDILQEMKRYDIIGGKVANDNTNATILLYIAGAFGAVGSAQADNMCISLFLPERLSDQYCFRTESALRCLTYKEKIEV